MKQYNVSTALEVLRSNKSGDYLVRGLAHDCILLRQLLPGTVRPDAQ